MPIGGFVVTCKPGDEGTTAGVLEKIDGIEVHGVDTKGNIVVVMETASTEAMQELIEKVMALPTVLHAGLTYLNVADEVDLGDDPSGMATKQSKHGKTNP